MWATIGHSASGASLARVKNRNEMKTEKVTKPMQNARTNKILDQIQPAQNGVIDVVSLAKQMITI